MSEYRSGLAEEGRARPVVIRSDGTLLVIAASHLEALCDAFLNEQIDAVELAYLVSALEQAPDFQFVSGAIEDFTSFLSSPVANGPSTTEIVTAVRRALREHSS